MIFLATILALVLVTLCPGLALAQNTSPTPSHNKTLKAQAAQKNKGDAQADKKPNLPAAIFVKADRERIDAVLTKQMKHKKFDFDGKDKDKIVFSRRAPGAEAAVQRRMYNRTLTSPIVDDPLTIISFILTEKFGGFVVVGYVTGTTILPNNQIYYFDLSNDKETRISLNLILKELKADAEKPSK